MSSRIILFIANFFFSLTTALAVYVLFPYLSTQMPDIYAGFVIAVGGLVAVFLFPLLPRLDVQYGAQKLALIFAYIEMFILFLLAATPGVISSVLLIIFMIALQPLLSYQLDLLLEATGAEGKDVGRVRAIFLTAWNAGLFIAPLLVGALLATSDAYGRIFIAAAAMTVPFVVLFTTQRLPSSTSDEPSSMRDTLMCIFHNRDLAAVTFGHLVLWLFYVWAPLYTPIYLHTILGFSWSDLGLIFSVMLAPYVLIEYPARWVADRFLAEKNLLLVGFLVAGGALASISLLTASSSLFLIFSILLASRAGAALVESMTEGHFFRRVTNNDVNSVSIFRAVWPLAYVIAPLIGSGILFFGNYTLLFVVTGGFIALVGTITTLFIQNPHTASFKTISTKCD